MVVLYDVEILDFNRMRDLEGLIYSFANEDKQCLSHELIYSNSIPMMTADPSEIIREYKRVQDLFQGKRPIGRRVFHEMLFIDKEDVELWKDDNRFWTLLADKCGKYYYDMGFQIFYLVHLDKGTGYHIHFAGNAVSYKNGRRWKINSESIADRRSCFNIFFADVVRILRGEETKVSLNRI